MSRYTGLAGLAINETILLGKSRAFGLSHIIYRNSIFKVYSHMKMDKIAPHWEVKPAIIKLKLPVQ